VEKWGIWDSNLSPCTNYLW